MKRTCNEQTLMILAKIILNSNIYDGINAEILKEIEHYGYVSGEFCDKHNIPYTVN